MHCYSESQRAVCCILPPHILKNVAQNGSPQQRARAMQTLSTDQTLRTLRTAESMQRRESLKRSPMAAKLESRRQRTISDCKRTQSLPGEVVRGETDGPREELATDEAHDGLGSTYDFFSKVFDRSSIDDEGMPLNASVHFGENYNNAFWDGQRMVFGDGDDELFNRFTISLDIIGHELGHGVTEDEGPLVYFFQAGALNESMSDVWGSLVRQFVRNEKAEDADWLIGAGLFTSGVKGVALRSMKKPGSAFDDPVLGKDPQPAHMEQFVDTYDDNGGVHINSGIPNHAFYVLATNLRGYAWERAGRIWYEALRDSRLRPNTGFRRFSRLTMLTAQRLYGAASVEAKAVVDAWDRVGIRIA